VSLRAIFFLLLLGNLVFLVWARFIDVPAETPHIDTTAQLPRLRLADEASTGDASPKSAGTSAAPRARNGGGTGAASGGGNGQGGAPAQATPTSPPQTAAPRPTAAPGPGAATAVTPVAPAESFARTVANSAPSRALGRCITVGPFEDEKRASDATQLLLDRGFHPRQHTDTGPPERRYWVYVGDLGSAAEQEQALRSLQASGLDDAQAMPDSSQGRRVSVGFFSERSGAERRARAVRALGLAAAIAERNQSEATRWVDVDLNGSSQTLPMDGLLSLQNAGSKLEIKTCPAVASANATGGLDTTAASIR
jgi:SPOR domain